MLISISIEGVSEDFIFDTGASGIVLNQSLFYSLWNSGKINQSSIKGKTKVGIADGSQVDALILEIKNLRIGNFYQPLAEAIFIDNPNAPALIGQSFLNHFGTITIDNTAKKILLQTASFVASNSNGNQSNPTNNTTITTNSSVSLSEIRLVFCNSSAFSKKIKLKTILQSKSNTTSDDPSIPPSKAVQKISNGMTIRYFDTADAQIAAELKKLLEQNFAGMSIQIENMLPAFNNNSIPKYIEIWIR